VRCEVRANPDRHRLMRSVALRRIYAAVKKIDLAKSRKVSGSGDVVELRGEASVVSGRRGLLQD
jgi:hypothetical protein